MKNIMATVILPATNLLGFASRSPRARQLGRIHRACLTLAGLSLLAAGGAWASEFKPWSVSLTLPVYQETDFKDIPGNLKITRRSVDLGYVLPAGKGVYAFQVEAEQSKYTAGGNPAFAGSSESDAQDLSVGVTYIHDIKPWSWYVTANLHDAVVDNVDFGKGGYTEFGGGLARVVNDKLKIGLAVIGRTQIEKDTAYGLVPFLEYNFNEHNRIGFVRSTDPSIGYTYIFNENHEIYVVVHSAQRQFRISSNQAVVDLEEGVRVGTTYHTQSGFTAEVFAGTVTRTLEFDRNGSKLVETGLDKTGFFGLGVSQRF